MIATGENGTAHFSLLAHLQPSQISWSKAAKYEGKGSSNLV